MSANVFKVGAVWHYRFQVAGDRIQKSTRLRDRARAEQLAQRAYDEAVVRANGGEPVPTLDELAGAWLEVHRPIVSAKHFTSVETFRRLHLYQLGDKAISDIGTKDVELARNEHLVDRRPATANHWLRVLKLLSLWAVKRKILAALPWNVAMLKLQRRPRAILPIDVTRAWFKAIDKATRRAPAAGTAVRMMFGLGLREGEAAGARWEWMDWERRTYTPGITKGREAEPVPVPTWLADYLTPLRRAAGLIAPKRDGTPFPPGFARAAMRAANDACSIKGITPHRLRGTFATQLSEAGVPIQTIQAVLRHKHPMTTMAYLEKSLDTAARAQNEIGARIDFTRPETGEASATSPSGD
ncbi:MAG: site-specific integrase [Pseudomonadota bacterium]